MCPLTQQSQLLERAHVCLTPSQLPVNVQTLAKQIVRALNSLTTEVLPVSTR